MQMNTAIYRRSDYEEYGEEASGHKGIHGMPTIDGLPHPEDQECTVPYCGSKEHVAMGCPKWRVPSDRALQKIIDLNEAEKMQERLTT